MPARKHQKRARRAAAPRPATVEAPRRLYLHDSAAGPARLRPSYDPRLRVTAAYRAALPDMQDATGAVRGADVPIQQVGVSGFRLPLLYATRRGKVELETRVTGTVSLEAGTKGINMSRIVRTFYENRHRVFSADLLGRILLDYRRRLGGFSARLRLDFRLPVLQQSLRSGLEGYQYYDAAIEAVLEESGRLRRFLHLDFVYSSACPCSAELAEQARDLRGAYAVPHSQRSKARVSVEIADGAKLRPEDLRAHCLAALVTETQVMVKREDEQAFAELNGAYLKFVEDAARLIYAELAKDARILDFQAACSHLESLHSHDAVSVICKGVPGGFTADFSAFGSLVC